jgi:3-hydroxyacyl-CoA dehydrogenase
LDERAGVRTDFERNAYTNYKNITVAGTGVLGSQIAYQTAYKGFHVNVYDVSEDILRHARERLAKLKENYKEDLGATQEAGMKLSTAFRFTRTLLKLLRVQIW